MTTANAASPASLQTRVRPWLTECFGPLIAGDREERNHRFLEEALELVQACGCSASEAHQLVDYVFGRPVGEPGQEGGGTAARRPRMERSAGVIQDFRAITAVWKFVAMTCASAAISIGKSSRPESTFFCSSRVRASSHWVSASSTERSNARRDSSWIPGDELAMKFTEGRGNAV